MFSLLQKKNYSTLKCRYKFRKATTVNLFTKKHGFAQGDSFSLQVALAYMMVWTKFMKCDPQQDHAITTGSFLDDSHFFCCCDTPGAAVSGICQSWRRSLEFDVITGPSCLLIIPVLWPQSRPAWTNFLPKIAWSAKNHLSLLDLLLWLWWLLLLVQTKTGALRTRYSSLFWNLLGAP